MPPDSTTQDGITRREVTKIAGLGGLFATAVSTSAAEDARGASLETTTDVTSEEPIEEPFTPLKWDAVGPFQYQRRDNMVDWLTPLGGEQAIANGSLPDTDDAYLPSELAAAGSAKWQHHELDEGETTIPLDFSGAIDPSGEGDFLPLIGDGLTDNHQGWFGYGGILLTRAYAFATFERDESGYAVLETDASQIWVNGRMLDATPTGVILQEGTNYVLVKQDTVLAAGDVDVEFRPPEASVEVTSIDRVPDLREGEETDRPAAVRVTNTTPDPVEDLTVSLEPEEGDLIEEREVGVEPSLAPFETRLVNTEIVTTGPVDPDGGGVEITTSEPGTASSSGMATTMAVEHVANDGDERRNQDVELQGTVEEAKTTIVVTAAVDGEEYTTSTELTVRGPDERFVTTYESAIDESVQYFGYRRPANYGDADGPFEAVHFLHGAGVDAASAAGSIEPRDDLYVIAPETRGPVAYDHEDLGRLDDNEALSVAMDRFDIDENQVYLLGHSMGGHGTWHVGMTHSDRYAAIGPQHSWPDHESYVIVPYKRDRLHTHPHLWAARETSLYKNLAGPNTENAADGNLPIFALHGGADDVTPPLMARNHVRMLANRGLSVYADGEEEYDGPGPDEVDVAYLEVPGADHWWDFDIGPGTDAVNHPDQYEWIRENDRDPFPKTVHFHTTNLAVENGKYWLTVVLQRRAHTSTRVAATVEDETIFVETENVARLVIDREIVDHHDLDETAVVDGEEYELRSRHVLNGRSDLGEQPIALDLVNGRVARKALPDGVFKTADRYGPIRQVHYDPYRIVYGTGGSDDETDAALALANLRSGRLVNRARAPATVIPDTAVTDDHVKNYNLVLVGTSESNELISTLNEESPIVVEDGTVTVKPRQRGRGRRPGLPAGRRDLGGDEIEVRERTYTGDLGVQYVYPNPDAPDRLVQVTSGTSVEGLSLNELVDWTPTFTPSPDYLIFDDEFRYQSFNACRAAGHFDTNWGLNPVLGEHRRTG